MSENHSFGRHGVMTDFIHLLEFEFDCDLRRVEISILYPFFGQNFSFNFDITN